MNHDHILAIMQRKTRLMPIFRDQPLEVILKVQKCINEIVDEQKQKAEEAIVRQKENEEKVKLLLEKATELNLSEEVLLSVLQKKEAPKGRYVYVDDFGERKYWSGRGRKPLPIKEAIEQGGSLEQFLVRP